MLSVLLFSACEKREIQPVSLEPSDMCGFCKMAISEKRYAAEFISKDGDPFKFDDIGCMIRNIENKQKREAIAAVFVVDFDSKEWLKAESARFLRSSEFKTPMNGGIAAFREKTIPDSSRGEWLSFDELFGKTQWTATQSLP